MMLVPRYPPGRANRKALQFASDIHRLRSQGYTFSAIRLALLDAGISVSLSTVKREAARPQTFAKHAQPAFNTERPRPPGPADRAPPEPQLPIPKRSPSIGPTGREIAEAFFDAHPSNPLFPTPETS